MRALVVSELAADYGGTWVQDIPTPRPGLGEALVRVRAAAVNFPDLLMTRGEYQLKPPLPFVAGMEFSGEVAEVGEGCDRSLIGEAVLGANRIGAMAEFALVPAATLRPKPERLSWAEAAGYRAAYLTAWVSLVRRAQVQPGEWVLVHGSAGGVGLATVDLANQLGARVIAAGSSPEKLAKVQQLYAPDAIVDVRQGFREQVKAITGGAGADVIFDPVGGDIFDESTRCIAFDGRLLVIGFTSGRIPSVNANIPLIKGFSVMGVRAGEYGRQFPEKGAENLAMVDAMAADGRIRPHVSAALPLDQWREGFDLLANRQVVGKAVLIP
ncbi:NADPH:quinone oxidoreductase family protein [Sphingomonas lacunae]|uniref:NADPH:quinone oxidoreductase family protein n=1 Tax=Sphingomonas lacunae TaxID=2698828 RepID=A0A6M4AQ43_9SPHN|nr:NADPH:quinone oxidoreductase family protein [Sphingomonas lacunae]QJQ31145.1 NADPH:quinone oxidoreductase family protein [Sphingomonas lacunae]